MKEREIMASRKDILLPDPNFLLNYLEEMSSDGDSDDDFDGYITDEDVEDEEESSCTVISSSTLTSCKESELALVQLVLVSYFLAHISLQDE